MASNLHARKKVMPEDEISGSGVGAAGAAASSSSSTIPMGSSSNNHNHGGIVMDRNDDPKEHRSKGHMISRLMRMMLELRLSCLISLPFILIGLLFGLLMMHHQHRKVILHVMRHPWYHGYHGVLHSGHHSGFHHHFYDKPRFVTVVLPSVVNPKGRPNRLSSIQDTWGPLSRALFVAHNITDFPPAVGHAVWSSNDQNIFQKPSDPYLFPQVLLLPNSIGEKDGVERLLYTLEMVHTQMDPDFAFFVNDHSYVIPEHLCLYLEKADPSQDMYVGHALKNNDLIFNSGAAGYLVSRSTMEKLLSQLRPPSPESDVNPNCDSKTTDSWLQGNPGLVTTKCLSDGLNIHAIDTRDEHKGHRFHAFPLTRVVSGNVDGWYNNKHQGISDRLHTDESYNTLLKGPACCAVDTISFHYVEYTETKALFTTREKLLEYPQSSDHELKAFMMAEWPRDHKVGGYSRKIPKESDDLAWKDLLATMRKISSRDTQCEC